MELIYCHFTKPLNGAMKFGMLQRKLRSHKIYIGKAPYKSEIVKIT